MNKHDAKKHDVLRVLARNRRARHEYHILEVFEAGLALTGTEVKAMRDGKIQLKDSYVDFNNNEAWLTATHVSPYSHGNRENHLPERPRKLLMSRREIDRLFGQVQGKGLTVVPLSIYLKGPWIKTEIALVQGKKLHDKRETEKRKELDREAQEAIKQQRW